MKYLLRTVDKDRRAHGGFQWPEEGLVEAPDWNPEPVCGGGLHGALNGEGDGSLFEWGDDRLWQVVEVNADEVVDLGGKVKVPRGWVIYTGSREEATKMIYDLCGMRAVIGGAATAGNRGTATAGFNGTATAGSYGTATAGYRGTATAGSYGTATAGDYGAIIIKFPYGDRIKLKVGHIGEDGLKPGVPYRLNADHEFEEATFQPESPKSVWRNALGK